MIRILYARLSQEDLQKKNGKEDDSNSILNQRLYLEKYAADHGFGYTKFISDDGYTGTNFNRPGWQEVMELVESDQVATIIVKDMSRLGREYLQVGQYTELIFPSYGVRFIAVNDGVDSLYENTNDFTPFRNIINEFYAKDCSKKGRTSARVKAETGARVASRPCYGYKKDPDDPKRHIVPDEDTAWVIQRIFALCVAGSGPMQIRKHKRRRANFAEQNMFSGLVYCADCGGTMVLHRAHTMDAVKNNFMCSTYKKKGKEVCSGHYIREVELAAVLLDDIRRITHFARQNELRFAEYIGVKQGKEAQREIAVLQKKAAEMERRKSELSAIFKRLYEDSVLGRIPDEQYRLLSRDYTREQADIDEALPKVTEQLQKLKDSAGNVNRFLENARKYTEIPELTCEILHTFIQRVEVGERAKRYDRNAPQEIRIYYRDIGLIDEMPETMKAEKEKPTHTEVA